MLNAQTAGDILTAALSTGAYFAEIFMEHTKKAVYSLQTALWIKRFPVKNAK